MDIRELDRRVVRASMGLVAMVTVEDLGRPTPCADWTLAELLAHMTAQHHGFAASAEGGGADLAAWRAEPLGDDAVPAYIKAAGRVMTAFAADGVLDREFSLPEVVTGMTFPAPQAISFHFIDYLVHSWDVARSLGVAFAPEPDLLEAAWPVAKLVPDDEQRLEPGAAFRPSLPAPDDATDFDRLLALLGRSPTWTP